VSPLTATAAALLAAPAVSALGGLVGTAAERLTGSAVCRERAWTVSFYLPIAAVAATAALAGWPRMPTAGPALSTLSSFIPAGAVSWDPTPWSLALTASALVGGGVALASLLASRWRMARLVAQAAPLTNDALLAAVTAFAPRPPALLVSAAVDQPFLVGVVRPVILLPCALAESLDVATLTRICVHELAHQTRGDNIRLGVETVVVGLLWFDPLIRRLGARMAAAREEVCDLAALGDASSTLRHAYAKALVHALRLRAGPELQTAFTGAGKATAMRLDSILHPPAPASAGSRLSIAALLTALAATVGLGSASLAAQTAAAPPAPPPAATIDITADRSETTTDGLTVWTGAPTARGLAPAADGPMRVTIDGAPAPAGLRLETVGPNGLERIEVRQSAGKATTQMNLVTRPQS
jgi:beta-lactamase regulating signal transducer with metallopeptidase domain